MKGPSQALSRLHDEMRACRKCLEAGYAIAPGAVFSGPTSARVMIVGQAPGVTEVTAKRPFNASSGQRLFEWLAQAGWDEDYFRAAQYMTAITKCYPGKPPGDNAKGDRVPTAAERKLCDHFLEQELTIVNPELIVPVGGLAVRRFLGPTKLAEVVGRVYEKDGYTIVPLPHPSGASLWLNRPQHQALVKQAVEELRRFREQMQ